MNVMSFKARIRNYAEENQITAQVVLQNFMFERFLVRLTRTEYRDKFVIKGGVLVAALVGLDTRATMDLDATLRNLPLTKEKVLEAVEKIANVDVRDEVEFEVKSISDIREEDEYGGFRISLTAAYDTVIVPLTIDVSTGDVITSEPVQFNLTSIFDEGESICLWGYNVETVLAEKVETILSRGILSTRPRDYYDVYILSRTQRFDETVFMEALKATAQHRHSENIIVDRQRILQRIENDKNLQNMWEKYKIKFVYAKDIRYEDVVKAIKYLLE